MREIEIKARVADKNALLEVLKMQNITLTEPVTQCDQVFGTEGANGGDGQSRPWLRIRTETKGDTTKQIFTLKKSVTSQLDSTEHETEIADEKELAKIIEHIGFTPYSDSTKTRQKAQIGEIELCVDSVNDLGDFVEAEKLTSEDANIDEVMDELWKVLGQFDVARDQQVTYGYDVLLRKAQGLEG
jgi:adenylate cyclase, class 2